MLLAGDIGGTKSRLAIFADGGDLPGAAAGGGSSQRPLRRDRAPDPGVPETERTGPRTRACLAVAGPVIDGRAAVTNLPWIADAEQIRRTFGFRSVRLLNDLAATARAVPLLDTRGTPYAPSGESRPPKGLSP